MSIRHNFWRLISEKRNKQLCCLLLAALQGAAATIYHGAARLVGTQSRGFDLPTGTFLGRRTWL